jgi:hypothetical protein
MNYFIYKNKAGNVEGEPRGLLKMRILPKKKIRTYIHTIKGLHNTFSEFKDIKCKGESPNLEEGKTALMRGRFPRSDGQYVEDCTFFEDDEYLINVAKDVIEHNFGVPIKTHAAMWITSGSGVCIYAYINESDSLMLFTTGTSKQRKKNKCAECSTPIQIVQGGGGNHKKAAVHRVMMMAISPICNPKQWVLWEVDHIDGITGNNDISNLRWVLPMTNKES